MGSEKVRGDDTLSNADWQEIRLRCAQEIERVCPLNADELRFINQQRLGKIQGFRVMTWSMSGVPRTKEIMGNLNRLAEGVEQLRTKYIYQGVSHPVKLICKEAPPLIRFVDFRSLDEEQQKKTWWSVVAAETRRVFDVQKDSMFRILGALTSDNRMKVLFSVYPYFQMPMDSKRLLSRIFTGMEILAGEFSLLDVDKVRKMNEDFTAANLEYWKKALGPLPEAIEVPGVLAESIGGARPRSIYKTIEPKLAFDVGGYCKEKNCSVKALFLSVWAELFGRSKNLSELILAVGDRGERLQMFPVKVRRELSVTERMEDIDRQMEEGLKNSACTFSELSEALGMDDKYFKVVFRDIVLGEEQDSDVFGGSSGSRDSVLLNVNTYYLGKELSVNYLFSSHDFLDVTVERLHDIFLRLLEEMIGAGAKKFNMREYIEQSRDADERKRKLMAAQNALYLKQTGFFTDENMELLIAIAAKSDLQSYVLNDLIMEENQPVCACALLVEGKVEESRLDFDGIVKSVSLRQSGDLLSPEALFEDNKSPFTYTVVSNEAKVLWVEREDMLDYLNQDPKGWRALASSIFKESCNMKRLWTMV